MAEKILIVGASGQLGSTLFGSLSSLGKVTGTYSQHAVPHLMKMDLTNISEVEDVFREFVPTIVINCAAMTNVDTCEEAKELAQNINVEGQAHLLAVGEKYKVKQVYISTYYVFDGTQGHYAEEDKPHPLNWYAETKIKAEEITLRNPRNLIVRTSKIYSYGKDSRNFLARLLLNLSAGKAIPLTTDQLTNPVSAEDLSLAIQKLIEIKAKGIYHVGGPDYLSNYEFALRVCRIFHLDSSLLLPQNSQEFQAAAQRPKRCALATQKLIKKTGVKPAGIEQNLRSWRESELKKT